MKKQFNQNGFSVVIVLVALALVSSGTYMVLQLNKNNKVTSSLAKNISIVELEKKRIASILADSHTCSLPANFGGTAGVNNDIASLVTANGQTLIAKNASYYDNLLTISKILVRATSGTPTPKDYEMVIQYADSDIAHNETTTVNGTTYKRNTRMNYIGKAHAVIVIPMYFEIVSGVVTNCYAKFDTTEIDKIIRASCSEGVMGTTLPPNTTPTNTTSSLKNVLNFMSGIINGCTNQINFVDTSDPLHENTTCPSPKLMAGFSTVATGTTSDYGNNLVFADSFTNTNGAANYCRGLADNTSGIKCASTGDSMYQVNASVPVCDSPGSVRNATTCANGEVPIWNSTSSVTCLNVNCSSFGYLLNSIGASGFTCDKAPVTTCPAGYYVSVFKTSGADTCSPIPIITKSCSAGQFGKQLVRATGTSNGNFVCGAYTNTITCSSPTNTTFAYGFSAGGASCVQY
jgi:hypothetical protein